MTPKANKYLMIGTAVFVAYLGYKWYQKRKQKEDPNVVQPPVNPIDPSRNSLIGKGAYANADNTYVRKDAYVNNSSILDPINNIVGVLKKDEFAGIIESVVYGRYDGRYWYSVNKGVNYNCPFFDCGITLPTKKGFVRSDVVSVK